MSDATRQCLIELFPECASRAVTIYNTISHHYFLEESSIERVPGIVRARLYGYDADAKDFNLVPEFLTLREQEFLIHL